MILAPLQKLPKNVGYLGKLFVAKGFKSPKVQKIANSGHTANKGHSNGLSLLHVSDCCSMENYKILYPFRNTTFCCSNMHQKQLV